ARQSNLPAPVSRLVGREQERDEVVRLLRANRLLTLTGAGGVGKTRLALAVAADLADDAAGGDHDYPDGAWLGEVAGLTDATLLPRAVAAAIGVSEQPARSLEDTLKEALRGRRLLLLLDNCEHLVAPCAALVASLLAACPRLSVLATSREALNVTGEVR